MFRRRSRWGAISKTNGAVLRYRDPVYRSLLPRGQASLLTRRDPFEREAARMVQYPKPDRAP